MKKRFVFIFVALSGLFAFSASDGHAAEYGIPPGKSNCPVVPSSTVYVDDHIDVITGDFRIVYIDFPQSDRGNECLLRQYGSSTSWSICSLSKEKNQIPVLKWRNVIEEKIQKNSQAVEKQQGPLAFEQGQKVSCEWEEDPLTGAPRMKKASGVLCSACKYIYSTYPIGGKHRLVRIEYSDQSCLAIEYYDEGVNQVGDEMVFLEEGDWRIGRVKEEKIPIGTNLFPVTKNAFFYFPGLTRVVDAHSHITEYHYSPEKYLTAIVHCHDDGNVYRMERLFWKENNNTQALCARVTFDSNRQVLAGRVFTYDEQGNIIEDALIGNLTGLCPVPPVFDEQTLTFSFCPEKDVTRYTYTEEAPYLLASQRCQNGLEIIYRYDANSYPIFKQVLDNGKPLYRYFYCYDENGNQTHSVSDNGWGQEESDFNEVTERRTTDISYVRQGPYQGRLESVIEKVWDSETKKEMTIGETVLHYLPTGGRRIEMTEFSWEGKRLPMCWWEEDELGNVCREGAEDQTFCWFEYDERGRQIRESSVDRIKPTRSVYDSMGHLLFRSFADEGDKEVIFRYQYDDLGNITSVCNQSGLEIQLSYDSWGRTTSVRYPLVSNGIDSLAQPEKRYVYNDLNQVIAAIDPEGYETRWDYNLRGQPTKIFYPDGTMESFIYEMHGSLREKIGRNGLRQVYEHDGLQKLISATTYSSEGDLLTTSQDEEQLTPLPHPKFPTHAIAFPSATKKDYGTEYNEREFVLPSGLFLLEIETVEQQTGVIRKIQKDALGRVVMEEERESSNDILCHTDKIYDLNGNVKIELHQRIYNNQCIGYYQIERLYGPFCRIEEVIERSSDGMEASTRYFYNSLGQLDAFVKNDRNTLRYEYDSSARLVSFYDSSATFSYQYQYDEKNRITAVYDLINHLDQYREYGCSQNMLCEHLAEGITVNYQYDVMGRCQEVTFPDGSGVGYSYEGAGLKKVYRISQEGKQLYQHEVVRSFASKFPKKVSLICDCGTVQWRIDGEGRPVRVFSQWMQEKVVSQTAMGSPMIIERVDPLGHDIAGYRYDKQDNCAHEKGDLAWNGCDSLRNRYEDSAHFQTVNGLNQKIQGQGMRCQYDLNGNVIEQDEGGRITRYRYDGLNRLIAVSTPSAEVEYRYDAFDRRICRIERSGDAANEHKQFFVYQGYDEIGAWEPGTGFSNLRILGFGWGGSIASAVAIEKDGKIYAPLYDLRGNLIALIDCQTKKCAEFYRFSVFGKEQIFNGNGELVGAERAISCWRFLSQRVDPETGLQFFGKRYYNPLLGRWMTTDPLGYRDGPNLYCFVHNNPLQYLDFYGLYSLNEFRNSLADKVDDVLIDLFGFDLEDISDFFSGVRTVVKHIQHKREEMNRMFNEFFQFAALTLFGSRVESALCGVHGKGEVSHFVRVSMINGILNVHADCLAIAKMISETHGNVNVHYVFRPTGGLLWDLAHALHMKSGVISKFAKQLVILWKELIKDMGGVDSGGVIVHYAHSLGALDTLMAKGLLNPEEKKMLMVVTFGSATLDAADDLGFLIHYVSRNDIVSMIADPFGWARALSEHPSHVWFLEPDGYVNHFMSSVPYQRACRERGFVFIDQYGRVIEDCLVA